MSDISIIKPKARRTDATAPTAAVLEDGEFAINVPGKKIYYRAGTTVLEIANADVSATGVGASGTWDINVTGTAARWSTARTLSLIGVITGNVSFDGSSNFSLSTAIADGALSIAKTSGLQVALDGKVNTTYTLTAGNGLTGGGTLAANRTITLGTPGSLSGTSTNAVTATSHTHELSANLSLWDAIDAHDIRALTNVGKVGSTSTGVSRIASAEDWSALPTGYSSFMRSDIGIANGAPVAGFGYFTKIAQRDTGTGWTGIWIDHQGSRSVRIGTADTGTVMPTWQRLMPDSWTLTAGNGLSGGGDGSANRTITLGTPGVVTSDTTNSLTTTGHTHEFRAEHLWLPDDRTAPVRTTPDTYRMRALSVGFNTTGNVGGGLNSVGGYYSTLTMAPWATHNSSHRQMQMLFPGDGHGVYYRRALDATTWDAPVKLLAHEDLNNIGAENLLLNSSFDQEPAQTAWSVSSNSGTNYTITQVAPINKSGRGKAVRVEITWLAGAAGRYMELNQTRTGLRPGQTYLASADIRAGGDATNVQLIVQSRNINGTLQTANHSPYPMDSVNRRGWVSRTLAADQDGMRVLIRFNIPATAGSAWFEVDDVMLHASETPTAWVPSMDDVQRNIQRMGVDASAGLIEDLEGASAYLGASTTGAIKIKIPNGFVNTMARMRVSLFSYASQRTAVEFIVGGYIYAGTGAGGFWVNHIATLMTGSTDLAPYTVRFGSEDGQPVIYIGELNTVWAYTHVVVSEFQAVVLGSPTLSDYERGWLVGTEKSAFGPTPSGVVHTTAPTAIATQLATARTIAVSGPVTGSASFNGTANVTLATSINLAHASVTGTLPAARLPTEAVRTDGSSVMSGPLQFSTGSVLRFNAATPAFFQGSDGSGDNALSFTRLASSSYLLTVFGTLTSTGLSVTGDGNGLDLHSGARIYKRNGSGITLRRHSDAWDPQVENAAGTQRWDILHAGNVGSATPDNALAVSKIDGLQPTLDAIYGEANVLPNGAFDDGMARWQTSGSSSQTTHVFDGTNDSGSGSGCIKWTDGLRLVHDEPISVKKGEVWIVKFDVKVNAAVTGSPESRIGLSTNMNAASWVGGMNQGNFILPLSTNWTTREYVMSPTVDAIGYLRFGVSSLSGGSGTEAWIDNVRLFRRGSLAEVTQQRLLIDELNAQVGPIPAAIEAKADKTTRILAGNGLQGGGTLGSDTTVRLGTPSTITNATTNTVMGESHTHALIVTKADVGLSNVVDVDVEALGLSANTQKHNIDGTSTSYDDRFGITTPGARFFYHSAGGAPPDAPWGAQTVGIHMGSPWMRGQIALSNGMMFYRQGTAAVSAWKTVVDTSRQLIAGNGLSGGGNLGADRTVTLGTPSTLSGSTTNNVTATSHTHELSANLSAWDAIAPSVKADVSALSDYVLKTWSLTAGNGMSGGGNATANRTITLGTPSTLSGSTTNAVTSTSHTHELSPNLKGWDELTPSTALVDRGNANNLDWNTLTNSGSYRVGQTGWGTTTNYPDGAYNFGTLVVFASGTNLSTTQMYYGHGFNRGIYTRTKWGTNDWSAWQRMWHSGDFDPANLMPTSWTLTAGNGLSGGGSGAANRTITLGTPGTLSGSTTNSVTSTSHTHALSANLTAWDAITPSAKLDATASAVSANTLTTARTINGTSFNGSANITTANWGTARTITLGGSGKSVNGSANVTWTAAELIGGQGIGNAAVGFGSSYTTPVTPANNGSGIMAGNGDSASATTNNLRLFSWYGLGFSPSIAGQPIPQWEYSHYFNVRNGDMNWRGVATGNGSGITNVAAEKLATARTINGVPFDGTANITITAQATVPLDVNFREIGIGSNRADALIYLAGTDGSIGIRTGTSTTAHRYYTFTPDGHFNVLNGTVTVGGTPVMLNTWTLTAGDGLSGGGNGTANRAIALGTPGTLSGSTTNAVQASSHTHAIANITDTAQATIFSGAGGSGGTNVPSLYMYKGGGFCFATNDGVSVRWDANGTMTTGAVPWARLTDVPSYLNLSAAGHQSITGSVSSLLYTSSNGNTGEKYRVGDDASLWDVGIAHTIGVRSTSNANLGYIQFGTGHTFGWNGSQLQFNNQEVWTNWSRPQLGRAAYIVGNWDDANENGWYMAAGAANAPLAGGDWWIARVTQHNADWIQQEAWQFTASAHVTRYRRHKQGGSWGAWTAEQTVSILTADNVNVGYYSGHGQSIGCSNWFRSLNDTGWYNTTYGGGIYMTDTTYVRAYNGKQMAAADFVISSDIRLKEEITPFRFNGRLRPVNFKMRETGEWDFGFIADEVAEFYPEAVGVIRKDGGLLDGKMIKQLSYQKLTAVISFQVNRLEDEVVTLKRRVKTLEATVESQEARLQKLEEELMWAAYS